MKNDFKEKLNNKIVNSVTTSAYKDLQAELYNNTNLDLYDVVNSLQNNKRLTINSLRKQIYKKRNNYDYSLALNLFLEKFIIENQAELETLRKEFVNKQENELEIKSTSNPNFYVDKKGKFYTFENSKYVLQNQIIEIYENGTYKTLEKTANARYQVAKIMNVDNTISTVQLLDLNNKPVERLSEIVKILNLKTEMVKKVKKIGYCGKSIDIWADIANLFYTPTTTGYYVDSKYNFYKWDFRNYQLIVNKRVGITPGAPSISDYEFLDSNTIIRTDYNGAGLNLQLA